MFSERTIQRATYYIIPFLWEIHRGRKYVSLPEEGKGEGSNFSWVQGLF